MTFGGLKNQSKPMQTKCGIQTHVKGHNYQKILPKIPYGQKFCLVTTGLKMAVLGKCSKCQIFSLTLQNASFDVLLVNMCVGALAVGDDMGQNTKK